MVSEGRESRRSRTVGDHSGTWATSSQDFVRVAGLLYESSGKEAERTDGNCSVYALAGIPMLLSALRCLLLELNAGMYGPVESGDILSQLADKANDVQVVCSNSSVSSELQVRLAPLIEVRHEIVHPAHRPGMEPSNTPTYLKALRDAGLLQSTGTEADYDWLAQLQSHRLFGWAFETVRMTVDVLLAKHVMPPFVAEGLRSSYSRFVVPVNSRGDR